MPGIKVSGITNEEDAKWAAILGVEFITVSLENGAEKKISMGRAMDIRNMLPSYTRFVAEFGGLNSMDDKVLNKLGPAYIQVRKKSIPRAIKDAPSEDHEEGVPDNFAEFQIDDVQDINAPQEDTQVGNQEESLEPAVDMQEPAEAETENDNVDDNTESSLEEPKDTVTGTTAPIATDTNAVEVDPEENITIDDSASAAEEPGLPGLEQDPAIGEIAEKLSSYEAMVIYEMDYENQEEGHEHLNYKFLQLNIPNPINNDALEELKNRYNMDNIIIHGDWPLAEIKRACKVLQPYAWSIKTVLDKSPRKIDYNKMKEYIREISLW